MSKRKSEDDIALDEHGRVRTMGEAAAARNDEIFSHPESVPVMAIAELHGEFGIRVFGPPSRESLELLVRVVKGYRNAVLAAERASKATIQ